MLRDRHYGVRFDYFLWQRQAAAFARQLARREPFDLFHQITFSNDWMPSFIAPRFPFPSSGVRSAAARECQAS